MISSLGKLLELDRLLIEHVVFFERLPFIDHLMPWINCLAQGGAIWLFILLCFATFHSLNGRKIFFLGSISMLVTFGFTWALKFLIHRPRPFSVATDILPLVNLLSEKPSGFSFPSGQTSLAFAATTVLLANTNNKYFKTLIFLLALLIGYSRVYEGVCYPLDVLAGAGLGLLCAKYVMSRMRLTKKGYSTYSQRMKYGNQGRIKVTKKVCRKKITAPSKRGLGDENG